MAELTPEGQRIVDAAAKRFFVSADAVRVVLEALVASGGGMAQFSHPDLGGMGQWSRGGMTMIGDMFNSGLKARVDALCSDLSEVVRRDATMPYRATSSQWQSQGNAASRDLPASTLFAGTTGRAGGGGDWWPAGLGAPSSTGAQNNMRYACFPDSRRLALDMDGRISVYDTGEHIITGFSQQQSGGQSLTFASQIGRVDLASLTEISATGGDAANETALPNQGAGPGSQRADLPSAQQGDVFGSIERLAGLRDKGMISEEEFSAKKTELLKRL